MRNYITHESALHYWNFPLAQQFFAKQIAMSGRTQLLVLDRSNMFTKDGYTTRLYSGQLPSKALTRIDKVDVVSPGLMFVQLAGKLDIHQAIILGTLLCSCPNGPRSEPLVTSKELQTFLDSMNKYYGLPNARTAIKYVNDRACSIMEVFVALFLSLPNHLGGLGLKGGYFNYKVELDPRGSAALGQGVCYIDYCFPDAKIACEYLGDEHKNTVDNDSVRNMALARMGYRVVTVTKSQLYHPEKLDQFLQQLAEMHGTKIRIRSKKYETAHRRICELLPRMSYPIDTIDAINQPQSSNFPSKKIVMSGRAQKPL
ncbi:MAG: hypothetical protein EOM03_11995 [Clostridia bacterium]|nr:hypothetical protein [Clostridia bacterium]